MRIDQINAEMDQIQARAEDLYMREMKGHERTDEEQKMVERDSVRADELRELQSQALEANYKAALGSMDPAAGDI